MVTPKSCTHPGQCDLAYLLLQCSYSRLGQEYRVLGRTETRSRLVLGSLAWRGGNSPPDCRALEDEVSQHSVLLFQACSHRGGRNLRIEQVATAHPEISFISARPAEQVAQQSLSPTRAGFFHDPGLGPEPFLGNSSTQWVGTPPHPCSIEHSVLRMLQQGSTPSSSPIWQQIVQIPGHGGVV